VKNIFSNINVFLILVFVKIFFYDFSRRVLQISSGIENSGGLVSNLVVALAVAWLICFLALSKGVQSLGKVKSINFLSYEKMKFVLLIQIECIFYCFISLCNVNRFNYSWCNIKWCY
jgi:hypothetical protein